MKEDLLLGRALEELYQRYNSREFVDPDPLIFLYRYDDVRDRELAALIASSLAFGNVRQIMASVGRVLEPMGDSPHRYLLSVGLPGLIKAYRGFRHRWAGEDDLIELLAGAGGVLRRYGSLEGALAESLGSNGGDLLPALRDFSALLREKSAGGKNCLLPCPGKGSACKRLHLFIKWLVRSDKVDPGGWNAVLPSSLIIPLDVHMHRFGRLLGFTDRRQGDIATAIEVTEGFRRFSPEDPVKYDFAVTRLGIRRDDDREDLLKLLGIAVSGSGRLRPIHNATEEKRETA